MDHISSDDRLARIDGHWLDWWETYWLRWRHYRAWSEWVQHIQNAQYHHEAAGEALHEAQFWRNRQIERGKDVSYNPAELNVWLDWAMAGFIGLAVICLIVGLVLGWLAR